MTNLDWTRLIVQGEQRTALFAEDFPARLDAVLQRAPVLRDSFDEVAALELLAQFAGAWGSLGRDDDHPHVRYIYLSGMPPDVLVFQAVELRPDQVVVADVRLLRPPLNS